MESNKKLAVYGALGLGALTLACLLHFRQRKRNVKEPEVKASSLEDGPPLLKSESQTPFVD